VDGDGVYHPNVTAPELGGYTAVLSVADQSIESLVHWSQKTSHINVVANTTELENEVRNLTNLTHILWGMYRNLSEEYIKLNSQVESLLAALPGKRKKNNECCYNDVAIIFSVVDDSCDDVDCSDHGICVQGECNCTYPYDGDDCSQCKFYFLCLNVSLMWLYYHRYSL
jgi:hypothetical protein